MKVSCQACGAKYTIADDKVRGRKVKIRCKSCGAPIVVDAQSEAPPALAPDPAKAAPAADAAPVAGAKNEAWSVNLSDTDQRNMTTDEIVAGWKSGVVTSDAFVWKDGMSDWVAILESEELRVLLSSPPVAADPTATPFGPTIVTAPTAAASKGLPAARASSARHRGGVDLFDAVEGGGAEEDVATSAPAFPAMAGTQPYDDGKLTGARNENSVLFSLDALKGGLTVEPAKKAPSAAKRDAVSDPLAAPSMLGGGGSPLFSLSADQALLTAPAPPDPPPRSVEASEGRPGRGPNKLVIYGGATAAAFALIGVGLLLGKSGKEETDKDGGKETAAVSSGTEKKAEKAEKEEKKAEEKKAEETKAEASASAAPSASAPEKKVAVGPSGEKKTPPASTTATGAATTPKKEEPAPAAGTAPFSVSAAQVALTQAATNSAGCKKPDGPTGSGKVQVTFATSGRVTSATVAGPPFAGTPVGGCVAGVFRKAKVPPYAGNPVTVSKSFSIK